MSLSPARERRPLATAATAVRQAGIVKLFDGSVAEGTKK